MYPQPEESVSSTALSLYYCCYFSTIRMTLTLLPLLPLQLLLRLRLDGTKVSNVCASAVIVVEERIKTPVGHISATLTNRNGRACRTPFADPARLNFTILRTSPGNLNSQIISCTRNPSLSSLDPCCIHPTYEMDCKAFSLTQMPT